jgi:anti-sigma-K factor RskA
MSASEDHGGPGERDEDFLAADYVLGVLDAAGRRRAAARIAADPAFAAEVAALEVRLVPLTGEVAPVAPPAEVWARVAAALPAAPAAVRRGAGLWESLSFWRGFGLGAAGLAAACLIAVAVLASRPTPRPPMPLVASLNERSGPGHMMVTVDRSHGMVMVMPAAMPPTPAQVPELWVMPPGGAPRSLGVISAEKPMRMKVPRELMTAMAPDVMLAVSMEPPGGSPTGKPTGPVVASGRLAVL